MALGASTSDCYHRSMTFVDRVARIRIELEGVAPAIWRRVEVPLTTSLRGLHEVIQAVMRFENYHLFQFDVGEKRYGMPNPEWDNQFGTIEAKNIKLGTLIERAINQFGYTYDFGDDWQHSITVEATMFADPTFDYPRFVDGSRRAPPEDVGGIPSFKAFLDAMTEPRHQERKRFITWYGRVFDPDDLDVPTVNARLAKLAKRRALGRHRICQK